MRIIIVVIVNCKTEGKAIILVICLDVMLANILKNQVEKKKGLTQTKYLQNKKLKKYIMKEKILKARLVHLKMKRNNFYKI